LEFAAMPDFDAQTTRFSAKNALLLARLSAAAYSDEAEAESITIGELMFTAFRWIDLSKHFNEDVFAIAAGCAEFAVIAFRGTKDVKNWMSDLYATPVSFPWLFESGPDVGDIHAGFGHATRDAWGEITSAMEAVLPPPGVAADIKGLSTTTQPTLWLTGHSLGAALAVLTGAAFSMWAPATMRPVNGLYTFGQPRVGLYRFCGNYDNLLNNRTFRFVNKEDLVPRVPFRGWDYSDIGKMIHFTSSGEPKLESPEWTNFLSRTLQSLRDFESIIGNIHTDVGDHSMDGYQQLVQSQAVALDDLFKKSL
jgi:triacylglycerol lipase